MGTGIVATGLRQWQDQTKASLVLPGGKLMMRKPLLQEAKILNELQTKNRLPKRANHG